MDTWLLWMALVVIVVAICFFCDFLCVGMLRAERHMAGRRPLPFGAFGAAFFPQNAQVAEQLREILARHLPVSLDRLHPDDKLVSELQMEALDSLACQEFLQDIEVTFVLRIPPQELEHWHTFRDVLDCVLRYRRRF